MCNSADNYKQGMNISNSNRIVNSRIIKNQGIINKQVELKI